MSSESNRPNVILIMVESWDGRVIGCLGDPALKDATPNIDKFASRGTLFKNHYTTHPICCPARANLWSGQYTFNCKSWNNHKGLEKGTKTLRDVLAGSGGYVFASKADNGRSRNPRIGIGKHDYMSGGHSQQNRVTAWTGAANIELPSYLQKSPVILKGHTRKVHVRDWNYLKRAKKFLKRQKAARTSSGARAPFFLYLSLVGPHPRFRTSRRWLKQVDYEKVSIPPKDRELHPTIKYQQISKAWKHGFDVDSVRRTRAIYYAMIAELDAVLGELFDALDKLDFDENTYVILTADHGENNMEHDMFYKMNMYESSVHVPLIITGPTVKQGAVVENPVSLTDLYPTILDIAGIDPGEAPNRLDGESLLPLLEGRTTESRNYAFSMYTGTAVNTSIFMIRRGKWKYVAYPGFEPQLFDVEADPWEINNLAAENGDVVKDLDVQLRKIVDYNVVHAEWQSYCKDAFRKWREDVRANPVRLFEYGAAKPRASYDEVMANTYKGWTKEHEAQLERWLESPDHPPSHD
ncbi:MAG: sulfatase family protein [Promethearchaeota archaeon]